MADFSRLADMPIIDAHVHFSDMRLMPDYLELMDITGVCQLSLLSTPHPRLANLNPQAFRFKSQHPDRVYMFAALDYSGILGAADPALTLPLAEQVDRLLAAGCDGIKMLEGKPAVRKRMGLAFDGEVYAGFFARVAERGVPILWHIADPEEFWDEELVPPGARAWGWFYGDGTFPTKESLYAEVSHVLDRHPNLKVIFAHFYFLSAQLARAAELLDRYPNVHLDITPGIEMYPNFTRRYDTARELFIQHQDRIVFGTDTGAWAALRSEPHLDVDESANNLWMMRNFLETGEEFAIGGDHALVSGEEPVLRGLDLPESALENIYSGNFRRLVGSVPKTLRMDLVDEELSRIAALVDAFEASPDSAWSAWDIDRPLAI